MESNDAVKRLAALAQESRLEVFRLLVKAGPEGVAAGEIARMLDTAAKHHVGAASGPLQRRADPRAPRGRSIIYAVDFPAMSELLIFLTEDCCGGRSEICAPLAAAASRCCKPAKGVRHEAPARAHRR